MYRLILNFWGGAQDAYDVRNLLASHTGVQTPHLSYTFVGDGQMDAFRAGTYTFVDTHLVQRDFGREFTFATLRWSGLCLCDARIWMCGVENV